MKYVECCLKPSKSNCEVNCRLWLNSTKMVFKLEKPAIKSADVNDTIPIFKTESYAVKVLGVQWLIDEDCFSFNIHPVGMNS